MLVTVLGMVIVSNDVQLANALLPILVTELGMVTDVFRLLQFMNAPSPILETELGESKVTDARLLQPANADLPMLVTELPILTDVRGLVLNASSTMLVTV